MRRKFILTALMIALAAPGYAALPHVDRTGATKWATNADIINSNIDDLDARDYPQARAWSATAVYHTGYLVSSGTSIYISKTDNNYGNAVTDPNNWELATSAGSGGTDVTLGTSSVGLQLSGQELTLPAATNAVTGAATSTQITQLEANTTAITGKADTTYVDARDALREPADTTILKEAEIATKTLFESVLFTLPAELDDGTADGQIPEWDNTAGKYGPAGVTTISVSTPLDYTAGTLSLPDGSIELAKLESTNSAVDGYALKVNAASGGIEYVAFPTGGSGGDGCTIGTSAPYKDDTGTDGDCLYYSGVYYIYDTDHWETLATGTDNLSNADRTPTGLAGAFTDVTNATVTTSYESTTDYTVAGVDPDTAISLSGTATTKEFQINSEGWRTAADTVSNNDVVGVRITSSGSYSTELTGIVTIGTESDTFSVTTEASGGGLTTASDTFTYSDGNLDTVSSAKWVTTPSRSDLVVASSQLAAVSTGSGNYWDNDTFGADQCSQIDVVAPGTPSSGSCHGPATRIGSASLNMYLLCADANASTSRIRKVVTSGSTTWTDFTSRSHTLAAGEELRLCVDGTRLTYYIDGILMGLETDTSLASGQPGIYKYRAETSDDWYAEEIDPAEVTDNFDRADGGLGTNWTTITSESAPQIDTYEIDAQISVGTRYGAYWNADSFGADQCAEMDITGYNSTQVSSGVGPSVRVASSAESFYTVRVNTQANTIRLRKMVSGTLTDLGTENSHTWDGSETVTLCVTGTTLVSYIDGVENDRTTDSSLSSGQPGFFSYRGDVMDNFKAYELTP